MKRALVVVVVACGGSPRPTTPPQPRDPKPVPVAQQGKITPEMFCDKFIALRDGGCDAFASVQMTRDECVSELSKAAGDPSEAAFMSQTGQCVVGFQTCKDVIACLAELGPNEQDLRACGEDKPGKAVGVPRAEWAKRNGAGVTKFSQATSSKERPIEVCTIAGEAEWLQELACDDGSHPIGGHEAAEMARVGNMGKGGRCGSIIDLYRVKCEDKTYDIYVDGYVCPQPK
ncbi:MAG: hypothetical protein JO257_13790 [Deltaproteobacteria bacterium]|nr:hypothetical protein [Deltaproteobacteria bacterium]